MRSIPGFAFLVLTSIVAQAQAPGSTSPQAPLGSQSSAQKQDIQAVLSEAHDKLAHGKSDEAISILQNLAKTAGPHAKGLQHELGIAYYRTGKLTLADQAFTQAIQQAPNDLEAIQLLGLTLYRLGRPADAIPYLEKVKQWTPNANADASHVLGLCYINTNRFDDARRAFAKQFSVPPDSAAAYLLLAEMLMQVNLPEAGADAARKASELSPGIPLAHFIMGEFDLFKSDIAGAQQEFEKERDINPGNFAVYDRLGDVYTRAGEYQKAQQALAKAISLETSSTGPFIQMGKVLLRLNDPQTALLYLQRAGKMDPSNYMTHALLGQAYRALGREDDAKKEIDIAAQIHEREQTRLEPTH